MLLTVMLAGESGAPAAFTHSLDALSPHNYNNEVHPWYESSRTDMFSPCVINNTHEDH